MKKYNITVNGTTYEVIVEEVDGSASHAPVYSAPVTPISAPAAPKVSAAANVGGANKVVAPMPGTILKINVTVGQAVKSGDSLCVLEAMKMENDIPAPQDGTVASIEITKGSSVQSGDVLITLN